MMVVGDFPNRHHLFVIPIERFSYIGKYLLQIAVFTVI